MAEKLNTGDRYPSMELDLLGGDKITLPTDITSRYALVLFYRGHW